MIATAWVWRLNQAGTILVFPAPVPTFLLFNPCSRPWYARLIAMGPVMSTR